MTQGKLFFDEEPALGELERWCVQRDYRCIVGVDEAGRGPLAGPVFAAAVVLDMTSLDASWIALLNDSKKLSPSQRDEAFEAIRHHAISYGIAESNHQVIDRVNILQATFRAMERAVSDVVKPLAKFPDCVFIDGNLPIQIDLPQRTVVKGDARSLHIAAASILAKVSRDRVMAEYHTKWPEYNFAKNKGYGTKEHRQAIAQFGPCEIHRRSFGGVKEFCSPHAPQQENT